MRLSGPFINSPSKFIQFGLFILIQLLLLFDRGFSKQDIISPLHLYDFLLLLLAIFSSYYFFTKREKFWITPLNILLGISLIYLAYSFITKLGPSEYVIRQFAIFGYMGVSWLIIASFISNETHDVNIRFIMLISVASFCVQIVYLIYLAIWDQSFLLFGHFNYFSQVVIIGYIGSVALAITHVKNWYYKLMIVSILLFISTTMGHSSLFLACFIVVGSYFILNLRRFHKIIALVILIAGLIMLFILPQFQGTTVLWRLLYWKQALAEIVINKYAILGHGFGAPYYDQDLQGVFNQHLRSGDLPYSVNSAYLIPMHNSFITIAFHVGLIPSILLWIPLRKTLSYFKDGRSGFRDRKTDFLVLTLIGAIVWSSFNVILELPHSSLFFWLIYFSVVYQFKMNNVEVQKLQSSV